MFFIVTGKPGSGKTSFTLDRVVYGKDFEGRDIYYRGIPELDVEKIQALQKGRWVELSDDDAKRWNEVVPPGSVIIIDEAQELWRVRPASSTVPPGIVALERHRHAGIDIFLMSQDGGLLDQNARKLCNQHIHYSRPFGAKVVFEYQSSSGYVNVESGNALKDMAKTSRAQPKRVFGLYKSAEIHTHKFKPPKLVYLVVIFIFMVPVGTWWLFNFWGRDSDSHSLIPTPDTVPQVGQAHASSPIGLSSPGRSVDWETAFTPAVAGLPFTAPLYRDLATKPLDLPRVAGCMAFENDQSDCRCYTQQGTRIWDLHTAICQRILLGGQFDPYLPPEPSGGRRGGDVEARDTPRGGQQTSL